MWCELKIIFFIMPQCCLLHNKVVVVCEGAAG